jgi:hypothetical protein
MASNAALPAAGIPAHLGIHITENDVHTVGWQVIQGLTQLLVEAVFGCCA